MSETPTTATDAPVRPEEVPKPLREQWQALLSGAEQCVPQRDLLDRLKEGRPLRVKIGMDPTAPDLHLGHAVPLTKLRKFQAFGHTVVFIIGDWTARIGDPSGKSETRPPLTEAQVREHAATYFEQVKRILDVEKTEVRHNGEWLDRLTSQEMIALASKCTVARMLEREDFKRRLREGRAISVHEFLYPLAQGYDSVAVEADVELGGTDQTFNLLMARDVQRDYGKRPQVIMTLPILEGLDGVEKMSKSLGNCVGISEEPGEMFGKLMSISDDLMWRYRLLCLGETAEQVESVKRQVASGELHPRDAKDGLAQAIVARYHGVDAAKGASKEFARVFRDRATPEVVDEITLHAQGGSIRAMEMLVQSNLSESKGEAKRLFAQGGVSVNGDRVADPKRAFPIGEYLVKVGPRRFAKVHVK